jgi:chitin-binding protein
VELTWIDSNSDRSDVTYTVARDGEQVGKSSGTSFTDLEIVPGEIYQYSVTASDVQGNQSAQSTIVNFTLAQNADADATAPTVPSNLHAMEVTATEVNLMWGESFDVSGTVTYNVYRDGYLRGTTQMTMWKDTSVTAGTTYQYVVKAVDSLSNESGSSNVLNASTIAPPAPAPAMAPAPESGGNWNSFAAYQAGDIVTLNGAIYRAVQSYQGVGNPNWIKAFSLWTPVADVASEPEVTPAPVPKPFAQWSATSAYQAGDRVVSSGANFEAVQSYQGVGDPNWINALSLWKKI